jgi:hypothetical protein
VSDETVGTQAVDSTNRAAEEYEAEREAPG